jgi:hypothetical protein
MTYRSHTRRTHPDDSRRTVAPVNRRFGAIVDQRAPLPAIPPLPISQVVQRQITDDLEALLSALPARVASPLRVMEDRDNLLEVVLDLGRPPEARFPGREVALAADDVDTVEYRRSDLSDRPSGIRDDRDHP